MKYAELFCQSNFSFLHGASHPEELVLQADFLRYSALAITDECSVAGVVRAWRAIKEHTLNIKLIVGSLFRLNDELDVILLCPNRMAYAELCRVITNARRRSEKGEYVLSEWDLMSVKTCLLLWLPRGDEKDAHWGAWLSRYYSNRVWVGLQRHLSAAEEEYIAHCERLAAHYSMSLTACGGVLMHSATRLPLQHILSAIRDGTTVDQAGHALLSNSERSLRSREKLSKLYREAWLSEAVSIAERCNFDLGELSYQYPAELIPKGHTPISWLRLLTERGALRRFPQGVPSDIQQIIDKELALIEEMDYPFFFLTIQDIVVFAQSQGILYQGRGSAANSVVCYCLEITSVDPRQISVLFERFISKERAEPPDIDVDFEHERREEVIQYIYKKYGRERAALAATVISYRFKSAIRDVGKALGLADIQLSHFIKNVNRRDKHAGWQAQLTELGLDPASSKGAQFISLVDEIIGFPRHLSQHVGGFVISSGPLYELVPVENAAMDGRTVIQWDKDDLEALKLLKVDILALGMLSAIRKCFDLVQRFTGRALTIAEITRMKDDPQVYGMIQRADTVGVFQIESRAQMSMLPRLLPRNYYDLVIQIAIVRPGPIQGDMVHPFLKRRNGQEPVTYPSKAVESVLSRTMGVPIFQEQVIKLAMVAAGFSGGEADQLRRAMASWKKNGQLGQFRDKLIKGMQARGYETAYAERIFEQICGFGEYGFPESHSASFAVLAYVSAWLKHHYPLAFYTALLNSHPMGFYSVSQLIQDAQRHGVTILPVCINHSLWEHCIETVNQGEALRLGCRIVKGLSQAAIEAVLEKRPAGGFSHLSMLKSTGIAQRDIQALASADALLALSGDRFCSRWAVMDDLDALPLFKGIDMGLPEHIYRPDEWTTLKEDMTATGLTLHKHPITLLAESGAITRFTRGSDLAHRPHKSLVTVVGLVTGRQSPSTAAGVTFLTLEDDTGNINVVVWAGTAQAQKKAFLTANALMIKGIVEREGDVIHVIAGQLTDLTDTLSGLAIGSRDFH
ncbi:error-prone DNA polymerase [Thaumasiovibrio sp. DFM-14]|uniref:error-prone DNA polymerase n=1 Tax=Thaumasiovibrio sp. DFM-14 TaxID=3384792 RepID=UPI00399F6ED7